MDFKKEVFSMKKFVSFAVSLMLLASLAACGKIDEALHMGNNFKIVDIDCDQMMLTVEDMSNPPIVEGKFNLQCKNVPIIYCNYEKSHEKADDPEVLQDLEFDDLIVGDELVVNAYEKDLESLKDEDSNRILKITQIQLGTQRLN